MTGEWVCISEADLREQEFPYTEEEMRLLDEPMICSCGRDLGDEPLPDCDHPWAHEDDVYK